MSSSSTPGRLDSLKGKRSGLSGAKPALGLKFKPKAVARRSKEERDADAPVVVEESDAPSARTNNHTKHGNGSRNKINRNAGKHIVSAGPLSSGFISMENNNKKDIRRMTSASPTPDFLKNLKIRTARDANSPSISTRGSTPSDDEDDFIENGDTKIDMSRRDIFEDDEQAELFPVRAQRVEHHEPSDTLPTLPTTKQEQPVQEEDALSKTESFEVKVKSEDDNEMPLPRVKSTLEAVPPAPATEQMSEEQLRLLKDHETLRSLLQSTKLKDTEGDVEMESESQTNESVNSHTTNLDDTNFVFFQLPKQLPGFTKAKTTASKAKAKKNTPSGEVKLEEGQEQNQADLNGKIGSLRYHKSGKVTMKIGNVLFDVTRGGTSNFLQDLVYINHAASDDNKNKKDTEMKMDEDLTDGQQAIKRAEAQLAPSEPEMYHLGRITEKIVVTPKVDGSFR